MIDTIRVQYRVELPEVDLSYWDKYGNTYSLKFRYEEQSFHATYIPCSFMDHNPMLRIQFSIPMILFGCNHRSIEISKLLNAVPDLDNLIHRFSPFIKLKSVSSAQLVRFDASANFPAGNLLPDYLAVIKKANYGRKKKNIYDTGIQFTSREETISIYDKYKMCKHPEAYGLLRLEVQIKTANLVKKKLGIEFPTIFDLNDVVLIGLLKEALVKLCLSEINTCCLTEAEKRIQEALHKNRALCRNTINYLRDTLSRTPEYIKDAYSSPTLRKYKNILIDIGISPYLVDKQIELPPLVL